MRSSVSQLEPSNKLSENIWSQMMMKRHLQNRWDTAEAVHSDTGFIRKEENLEINLWTWGEGKRGEMYGKSNLETYITICKIDSQQEFAVWLRKLKQGLCINLEGWDGEGDGRQVQKGGDICIPITDSC